MREKTANGKKVIKMKKGIAKLNTKLQFNKTNKNQFQDNPLTLFQYPQ